MAVRVYFGLLPVKWPFTLLMLALFSLFCRLGVWQWQRFEYKNIQQENSPSLQPIQLQGHFLNQKSFLLDNQLYQGQAGYQVFSLFKTEREVILINRGWIQKNKIKTLADPLLNSIPPGSRLLSSKPLNRTLSLKGRKMPPPVPGLRWKQPLPQSHPWGVRVLWIDLKEISKTVGYPLTPFIVELDAEDPHVFIYRASSISSPSGTLALKHLGYAFQWFMMATALLIYYLVINIRNEYKTD